MAAAIPEIIIKDEENEFDSKEFKVEYAKIYRDVVQYQKHSIKNKFYREHILYRDVVQYTTPMITALNGLPVYCRYHINNGLALGKGLKIGRYQDFTKKRNQVADVLQACCRRVAGVCRSVYVIRTLLRSATNLKSVKRKNAKRSQRDSFFKFFF